jgi:hypothetical protein
MTTRNHYRKKANDCIAQAEAMRDAKERVILLQLAQGYLKLADLVGERHDRGTAHRDQGD